MAKNGGITHDLHSVTMEKALIIAGAAFAPSIVKRVKGGIYFYTSYWMDTDMTLTWSGVVCYRKLRRILRKHKDEFKQAEKEAEFYRSINNNY